MGIVPEVGSEPGNSGVVAVVKDVPVAEDNNPRPTVSEEVLGAIPLLSGKPRELRDMLKQRRSVQP